MKIQIACVLLALLVATACASDVIKLTDDNLEQHTSKSLAIFFYKSAGKDKSYQDSLDKFVEASGLAISSLTFATADCSNEIDPCLDFGIGTKGKFPVILLSKSKSRYYGEFEPTAIHQWAVQEVFGDVVPLRTGSDAKEGDWVVEFSQPWCGHCTQFFPTLKKLATHLKGKVNVANVDCSGEGSECQQYGINGFPTIQYWSGGEKVGTYEGPREWNDLLAWIDRRGQPLPVAEAEETDDVEDVPEIHVHEEL